MNNLLWSDLLEYDMEETEMEMDTEKTNEENEEKERFKIKTIEQLSWALRKIKALKVKQEEIDSIFEHEKKRIEEWYKKETEKLNNNISFFEELIKEYAEKTKKEKGECKITTPYGKVKYRKTQPKIEVEQTEKLISILEKNNLDELIKIKKEVQKSAIKDALKKGLLIEKEGLVFNPITGEQIEEIKLIREEDKLVIEVE